MLGLAGAAGGGLLGATLGRGFDALSTPRRALWGALGMPDTGRELVSNAFGLDPEGAAAGALGLGAETLLDPLTIGGLAAGGPLAKLAYAPWAQDARIASMIGDVRAGVGGADAALAARAATEAQTIEAEVQAARRLGQLDIPGIAAGDTVDYVNSAQGALAHAVDRGVGLPGPIDPANPQRVPVTFYGNQIPAAAGFEANPVPVRGPVGGKMAGSGPALNQAMDPALVPRPLTRFDRQFLSDYGNDPALGVGHPMNRAEAADALEALGQALGGQANAARPMPTFGQAVADNPLLGELIGGRMGSLPGASPLPAARAEMAAEAARLQQLLQSRMMTPADWRMVAGAGALGVGAGAGSNYGRR